MSETKNYYLVARVKGYMGSRMVDQNPHFVKNGCAYNYADDEEYISDVFESLENARQELSKYSSYLDTNTSPYIWGKYSVEEYYIYQVVYDSDELAEELKEAEEPVNSSNLIDWSSYIDMYPIENTHFDFKVECWNKETSKTQLVCCEDYADALDVQKEWDDRLLEHNVLDFSLEIVQNLPDEPTFTSQEFLANKDLY